MKVWVRILVKREVWGRLEDRFSIPGGSRQLHLLHYMATPTNEKMSFW